MTPRRCLFLLPLLLPAAAARAQGHGHPARAGQVSIENPWTRAAGAGGQGAGYMVLRNAGAVEDRLVAASSPVAQRIELHTHIRDGEVMRMRAVEHIAVPPGGAAELRPGGLHLMFIGLRRPLEQGGRVPVTLRFERGGEVTVELRVEAAGARGPGGHHGH